MAKEDSRITQSHSVDAAEARHAKKPRRSKSADRESELIFRVALKRFAPGTHY